MIPYNIERTNTLLSTSTDLIYIVGGSTRSWALVEYDGQGEMTASAANQVGIYNVNTLAVTPATAILPMTPLHPNMTGTTPALAFSGTVWGSAATPAAITAGTPMARFSVNANGGRPYWKANVNFNNAYWMPGGATAASAMSVRGIAVNGSTQMSLRLGIVEA
jgi:hypothetical protein